MGEWFDFNCGYNACIDEILKGEEWKMLSRNANYDMNEALDEIKEKKLILDTKVETQLILQLLVSKGIVTREEVSAMREKVKNSQKYKTSYEYLENAEQKAKYYKSNPEQHLKDILNAKMNGTIT